MEAISDPELEGIVWVAASQVGKTEAELNAIGTWVDLDPGPILIVYPTLAVAQDYSKDRLTPMFRDSPRLKNKLADNKERSADNSLLHKRFPGGHVTLAGANSTASLASRPIRYLICDEVSRWEQSAGKEGDPLSLAFKRTITFHNRKIILVSSPGNDGVCRISAAFEETDKRYYYIPCPKCGLFQRLEWRNIRWDRGPSGEHLPDTVYYLCDGCQAHIREREKQAMLEAGEWKATCKPNNPKYAGFHLNALYSPWLSWKDIVVEHLETDRTRDALRRQVFVNTVLAETWRVKGEGFEADSLLTRREPYTAEELPEGVLLLVAGVDVQDGMLQWEVIGYGRNNESWGIEWGQVIGDLNQQDPWAALDGVLLREYKMKSGNKMGIVTVGIDSGGHHTQTVYQFCKARHFRRVYAIKWRGGMGVNALSKPNTVEPSKCMLFTLGVDKLKEDLYNRLKITEPGPGYCHFPVQYGADIMEQFTSEEQKTTFRNGFPHQAWVKKNNTIRNEGLDIRNYAHAMMLILNPDWDAIAENVFRQVQATQEVKKSLPAQRNWATDW
jgi:phage terminase large subunit GpA-like protein